MPGNMATAESVLIFPELVNQPALLFVGFVFAFRGIQRGLLLALFDLLLAFFGAGWVFLVPARRYAG